MKKIFILLILANISHITFASSIDVSGTIASNTHWTGVDTVKLTGNITINDGITLLIDPGIVIEAQGMYGFDVQGRIVAIGTETDSIKFTALDKGTGWNRFLFVGTPASNDSSYFNYCVFEYGLPVNGPDVNKDGGAFYVNGFSKLYIGNSLFRYNQGTNAVVYIVNGQIVIDHNIFTDNTNYCILTTGSYSSIVSNNMFIDNSGSVIYSGNNDNSYFINNVIKGNSSGFFGYESGAILVNNTIVSNLGSGLILNSNSNITIYNTIIWDNTFQVNLLNDNTDPNFYYCNIEGGSAGFTGAGSGAQYTGAYVQNIDEDPLFTDPIVNDYSISIASPCYNRGVLHTSLPSYDVTGLPRISDDFVDIGAYEYYVGTDTICDETWTAANSPYIINANLIIPDGCSLTIEPGVEIVFNGFYKMRAFGSINAVGTEEDSIKFYATNTIEGWQGIKYVDNTSSDVSLFKYCVFKNAITSNYTHTNHSDGAAFQLNDFQHVKVSNSMFRNNQGYNACIFISGTSKIELTDNAFINNDGYSMMTIGDIQNIVSKNKFFNNNGTAIYSGYGDTTFYAGNLLTDNTSAYFCYESKATIVNNTIVNNTSFGIRMNSNSNINIYNTIIRNNVQDVSMLNDNTDPDFYNCNILGDSSSFEGSGAHANYTGVYENCIDTLPYFVDELANNFHLSDSSPCINTGYTDTTGLLLPPTDLNGYFRVDGGIIDIGAYERDITSPIPVIDAGVTTTDLITITANITFNEGISGLEIVDILVSNGNSSNLTPIAEGLEYEVDITATAEGNVTVELPAGSVIDNSGNENIAASVNYSYDIPSGIQESIQNQIHIFPNPVKDVFTVISDDEMTISFTDITGKKLFILNNCYEKTLNISDLPSGIYLLKIQIKDQIVICKIIKE